MSTWGGETRLILEGGDPEPDDRGGEERRVPVAIVDVCAGGEAGGVRSGSCCRPEPAGPGVGFRPSRKALAMSAAFHFAYLIFSSLWVKRN